MDASPPSKRTKLDPSPSTNAQDIDDPEQAHCTICLQSFLDRTIIPVCSHEFCFECILLWAEQSRKCPLCARSFDDSHLIHQIRSQYDYQKHYLPPPRSSSPPGDSHAVALRNARRERQWGRRQRQQREEADQLERAIARRRWIYQHHLYAKHVASNPYTRYRPFPTPAQFAASSDLISRMTTFLRRELHVWPNLDVEFLTTYTISLMKSIDIRSESAVKLLSEFLDLDTPYTAGERRVNAEHFAHEIYSYLRSPYRDLRIYDQIAQYVMPPDISPPQEIERGRRWSPELSSPHPSHTQPNPRRQPPGPRRKNSAIHAPAVEHGTDSSAETRPEDRPNRRHRRNRSPRHTPPDREDNDPCNHPSGAKCSPLNGIQNSFPGSHSQPGGMSCPEAPCSAAPAENHGNSLAPQLNLRDGDKGKSGLMESMEKITPAADATKMNACQDDNSATVSVVGEAGTSRLMERGDGNYVDQDRNGSSANPQQSRKRSAGLRARILHPRNRTLSESIQAHLSRPATLQRPTKEPSALGDQRSARAHTTIRRTTDTRPSLLLRLSDGPTDSDADKLPCPRKISVGKTANGDLSAPNDTASEQQRDGPHILPLNRRSSTATEHPSAAVRPCHFLPNTSDEVPGVLHPADSRLRFPPVPTNAPLTNSANDADGHPGLTASRQGPGHFRVGMGAARVTSDQARPGDDDATLRPDSLARGSPLDSAAAPASAPLDNRARKHGGPHNGTNTDPSPGADVSRGTRAPVPSSSKNGGRRETDDMAMGYAAAGDASTFGPGSGPDPASSTSDTSTSERETRLQLRARLQVRLAAMKVVGATRSEPASSSDLGSVRRSAEDDMTARRQTESPDPTRVAVAVSGKRGDDGHDGGGGFGADVAAGDGDGIRDKDKVGDEATAARTSDQERREVALRNVLSLRAGGGALIRGHGLGLGG